MNTIEPSDRPAEPQEVAKQTPHVLDHGVATGTWTAPDGSTTTVTFDREQRDYRYTGHLYSSPITRSEERKVEQLWPDRQTLAAVLADLERYGHVPADDDDTQEIRARLMVGEEWAVPVPERELAAVDNPGRGASKKVYVSVTIPEEGHPGERLVFVDGGECMTPATALEVARAVTEAAHVAAGGHPIDDEEPGEPPAGIDRETWGAARRLIRRLRRFEDMVRQLGALVAKTRPADTDAEAARAARRDAERRLAETVAMWPEVRAAAAAVRGDQPAEHGTGEPCDDPDCRRCWLPPGDLGPYAPGVDAEQWFADQEREAGQ